VVGETGVRCRAVGGNPQGRGCPCPCIHSFTVDSETRFFAQESLAREKALAVRHILLARYLKTWFLSAIKTVFFRVRNVNCRTRQNVAQAGKTLYSSVEIS
jgi:hypothetical protein